MAELIVMAIDKVNAESIYLDAMCYKRGDVIVIKEDGHPWSKEEREHPRWTIVKAPGVPFENLAAFTQLDPGDPKVNRMLQKRAHKFDLDAHEKAGNPTHDEQSLMKHKKLKPPLTDPNVIV